MWRPCESVAVAGWVRRACPARVRGCGARLRCLGGDDAVPVVGELCGTSVRHSWSSGPGRSRSGPGLLIAAILKGRSWAGRP